MTEGGTSLGPFALKREGRLRGSTIESTNGGEGDSEDSEALGSQISRDWGGGERLKREGEGRKKRGSEGRRGRRVLMGI